jgi:hypothetical protein
LRTEIGRGLPEGMRRDKSGRMRRFWILLEIVVVGLLLTQTMDVRTKQPTGKGLISLNFQDTDLRVVVKFIS